VTDGKNGRILFDRPKPTVGCSASGRRRIMFDLILIITNIYPTVIKVETALSLRHSVPKRNSVFFFADFYRTPSFAQRQDSSGKCSHFLVTLLQQDPDLQHRQLIRS
jgi:hypothetical protein